MYRIGYEEKSFILVLAHAWRSWGNPQKYQY